MEVADGAMRLPRQLPEWLGRMSPGWEEEEEDEERREEAAEATFPLRDVRFALVSIVIVLVCSYCYNVFFGTWQLG